MTARPSIRHPGTPVAAPATTIAAEVRVASDALERAVAAGEGLRDDVRLEIVVDDLAVIAGDLALVARDLEGLGK